MGASNRFFLFFLLFSKQHWFPICQLCLQTSASCVEWSVRMSLFRTGERIIQNTKISPKELIQLDVLSQQNPLCQHFLTVLTFLSLFLWRSSSLSVASSHPLLGLSSCISCLCCAHTTQQSGLLQHIWCDFTQVAGFPSLNGFGPYEERVDSCSTRASFPFPLNNQLLFLSFWSSLYCCLFWFMRLNSSLHFWSVN